MNDNPTFTKEWLSTFLDTSVAVIEAWESQGIGPEFIEIETPQGVKRLYTAEAVRAFCLKHRTFPTADGGAARGARPTDPDNGSLIGGGELTGKP